jgi:murein DD-endopeptidase MepM/ murein hydrolase activator NlpD
MADTHTLIFLAEGAEVTRAENAGTYGNVIDITAKKPCRVKGKAKDARVTIRRAHCHTLLAEKGDKLPLWGQYATLGTTGKSTGPHEHLEAWVDGVRINPHNLEIHVPFLPGQQTYIVRPGDTYYKVSQVTGVAVDNLRK